MRSVPGNALVLEANRGGVLVDVGLRGVIRISQLVSIGAIDMREHARRPKGARRWRHVVEPTSLHRLGTVVKVRCHRVRTTRVSARPVRPSMPMVKRVIPYGAFARLVEGVEGLIHVTELGGERVADQAGSVHVGDVAPVRIRGDRPGAAEAVFSARLAERT